MKMKELIETTHWDIPNHTYYVSRERGKTSGKLLGFKHTGTEHIHWFQTPMKFDTRYRTFITKELELEAK